MEPILELIDVAAGYANRKVLTNISFDISSGDIVVLAGANGAGKSTILKAIFGLGSVWHEGVVKFSGGVLDGNTPEDLIRKGVVYIPQKNNVYESLTVLENLQLASLRTKGGQSRSIDQVLETNNVLNKKAKLVAGNLSGGEKQLLALAMGFLHSPRLVLFDEPSAGLDVKNFRQLLGQIKLLNSTDNVTFLLVEHRLREVCQIADWLIGIKLGKVELITNEFNIEKCLKQIY
ncbi:ATP-binding cassette domain-containing protein [Desulfovibrio sp. JC010]|uniref:ATP-binding cassette domain-containing protein n=1 Tax=Desulfovibrio sp. JC010 TaxID=2593641 RepID=UPI001EF274CB|nr:ATP-binding cassette domain-containing protein [Desulfovibrio sp. JC010]